MARPPKLSIHEPYYQVKDFFVDESRKRIIPRNPYNLLWLIENAFNNDDKYKHLKNVVLLAIKNDSIVDNKIYPEIIRQALIEEKWIIKRIQELYRDYKVDITGVALKAIRIGTGEMMKELLSLGLDPNYVDSDNRSTLSTSVSNKKNKTLNILFEHPETNRYMLNQDGENVAFTCIRYGNWKFLEKIIDKEPKLLFVLNKKNESIFDLLGQQVYSQEVFTTIPIGLKDKLTKIMDDMHASNFNFPIPSQGQEVIEFIIHHNHARLQKSMQEKENSKEMVRKI